MATKNQPTKIEDFATTQSTKQWYQRVDSTPQSKKPYASDMRVQLINQTQKPSATVQASSVASNGTAYVTPAKPVARIMPSAMNSIALTNKREFRNAKENFRQNYASKYQNGTPVYKEQYTVIPVAGRNEWFKVSADARFYEYAGSANVIGRSRVKNANSYKESSSAQSLGKMITAMKNNPVSQYQVQKRNAEAKK